VKISHLPHNRTVLLSFALAATTLVLCALLLLEWKGGTAAVESFEWVSHTLEIQRELATIEARMSEVQSAQANFLLTSQPGALAPYNSAVNEVRTRLTNVKQLVADNPAQLRRVVRVESLIKAKLTELDSTIQLGRGGNRNAALAIVGTKHSDSLMTGIRAGLQGSINAEQALLRTRQSDLATELRSGDLVSLALAGGLGLMMIALLFVARSAEHYRNLVTLCAWTRSVEYEGEWISFEEYLRRRFNLSTTHGISPEAIGKIEAELEEPAKV
jgi:CHASE3 domain sensor protein